MKIPGVIKVVAGLGNPAGHDMPVSMSLSLLKQGSRCSTE